MSNSYGLISIGTFVIIIVVIIIIAIIAISVFLIYNNIHKKRLECLYKYGKLYSSYIELQKKYPFVSFNYVYPINHYVDTHKKLDNFNMKDLAIHHYVNNINNVKNTFFDYIKNENIYIQFSKEYSQLTQNNSEYEAYKYDDELVRKYCFKNSDAFKEYEKAYVMALKPYNANVFKIRVAVNYVTPKTRHHFYKISEFTKNDIITFEKISKDRNGLYDEKEYQRSLMSDSLRYNVLKRDNFRCCICGRTSKEGVKLEVDHIIPISKGGMTVMSNLQTLCKECNRGKSDKTE